MVKKTKTTPCPMIFRLTADQKVDFQVALLRNRVTMQSFFSVVVDVLNAHEKGAKNPLLMDILKKAQVS